MKEACSPRPPSSEITEASRGGPAGCPFAAGALEEPLVGAGDGDREVDGPSGRGTGGWSGKLELAVGPVAGAGEDGQDAAGSVVGDGEKVELGAVVVGREAGGLLVVSGAKA